MKLFMRNKVEFRFKKITISGKLGSGKSTVAKMLAEKLGYKHYSSGDFMRELAKERNMTLMQLSIQAEKDDSVDFVIDERQKKLGKNSDRFVLDARLGFYFIPGSYKIFLDVQENEAIKRVLNGFKNKEPGRLAEGLKEEFDDVLISLKNRRDSEKRRYKKLYGVDYEDINNYDLIIDTTNISPDEVVSKLIESMKKG